MDGVTEFEEHPGPKSSWASAAYAGWSRNSRTYTTDGAGDGRWTWPSKPGREAVGEWATEVDGLTKRRWRDFSWLAAGPLLDSANDQVANLIHDLVNDRRQRWVAARRAAGAHEKWKNLVVDESRATSFFVLGDPGEADPTQYGVVEPMLAVHGSEGSDFALILSDVIYPAGDINDYVNAFYVPYEHYPRTMYALPGNHDWYDGLNGFMFHFCGAEPLPPVKFRRSTYTAPERLARRMWRDGARPFRPRLLQYRREAERNPKDRAWAPRQPGPYFAIDVGDELRLVSIDSGIRGTLDREQGEWLVRTSRESSRVKILLTGKPLWVDGAYHPCPIEWEGGRDYPGGYETVDDVVRDPDNGYVATIGGDIHNYQRYVVRVKRDGSTRTLPYLVSGGAGAYMSATHSFRKVHHTKRERRDDRESRLADQQAGLKPRPRGIDPPDEVEDVTEEGFRCYPTRPDSLAFYARSYGRRVAHTGLFLGIVAGLIVGALFLFASGWHTKVGDQTFLQIALVACVTQFAIAALGGAMAVIARFIAPQGYKFPVVVLATPILVFGLIEVLRLLPAHTWAWVWKAGLLSLGTLLLPLAIVLVVYYSFGSSGRPSTELIVPRAIVFGVLLMGEIALWHDWDHVEGAEELALLICGALACIAAIVLVVGWAMRWQRARLVARRAFRWAGQRWWFNVPATVLVYGAFIGPTIARGWDNWEVQVLVWAAAALWLAFALVYWAVLLAWARLAVTGSLFGGRLDPAQAARWLEDRGYSAGVDDSRISASRNRPEQWLCDFLMRWPARIKVSEIGNDDKPPMFKSFLHAEIESVDGRRELRISCYGVTGWRAHETAGEVPREDSLRIDLSAALTELAARRAGVKTEAGAG